jgi:hypothetical protein
VDHNIIAVSKGEGEKRQQKGLHETTGTINDTTWQPSLSSDSTPVNDATIVPTKSTLICSKKARCWTANDATFLFLFAGMNRRVFPNSHQQAYQSIVLYTQIQSKEQNQDIPWW